MSRSREFTDQLGRRVEVNYPPQRIVSLVPSQTELLHALGLDDQVKGITRFCVHPRHWFLSKTRVGGTKDIDLRRIMALQPDLVIANKEENIREGVEALSQRLPVWVSEVNTLHHALEMITGIADLTNSRDRGSSLRNRIEMAFSDFGTPQIGTAVYLIWMNPLMGAGRDTFILDMMKRAGFENLLTNLPDRYPLITEELLIELNPEYLLLSSEPYPFKDEHIQHFRRILPQSKVVLVDGELFSWYGPRLLESPTYFRKFLRDAD